MNALTHLGAHQIPGNDLEKRGELKDCSINVDTIASGTLADTSRKSFTFSEQNDIAPTPVLLKGRLAQWNAKVEDLAGLEARGITRVLLGERHGGGLMGYLQMFALWFSINLVAINLVVGFLGPLVFNLAGWIASALSSSPTLSPHAEHLI